MHSPSTISERKICVWIANNMTVGLGKSDSKHGACSFCELLNFTLGNAVVGMSQRMTVLSQYFNFIHLFRSDSNTKEAGAEEDEQRSAGKGPGKANSYRFLGTYNYSCWFSLVLQTSTAALL